MKYIVIAAVIGFSVGAFVSALYWSLLLNKKKDEKVAYDMVYPNVTCRSLNIRELKVKSFFPAGYGLLRDDEEKIKALMKNELAHKLAEELKPFMNFYHEGDRLVADMILEKRFCASIKVIDERGKDD